MKMVATDQQETIDLLRYIKTMTDKGADLDFGGQKANFRKRRLVCNMHMDGLLKTSGAIPERCIIGLTEAGLILLSNAHRRRLRETP